MGTIPIYIDDPDCVRTQVYGNNWKGSTRDLLYGSAVNPIIYSNIDKNGSAYLEINPNPPQTLASIKITPSTLLIKAGGSQAFSAQGYDGNNNPISGLTYSWLISDLNAGNIGSDGLFTAGMIPGTYSAAVQVTSGSVTATVSVIVTPSTQAYDINQDGNVNVLDLILIGQHMNEAGTPGWIPQDVNNDGLINVLDSILVGQNTSA
jgi:hypothetical protein